MQSIFHHLSLRSKLALLAFAPICMVLFFAALHLKQLNDVYQATTENNRIVQITQKLANLVFELQKERGLSAGYYHSRHTKSLEKLQQQRAATNHHLSALQKNENLALLNTIQTIAPHKEEGVTKASSPNLADYHNYIEGLRLGVDDQSVDSFFNVYSNLNQQLINLISQLQLKTHDVEQQRAFVDLVNILRVQELAGIERGRLNQILSRIEFDMHEYHQIQISIVQQESAIQTALNTPIAQNRQFIQDVTDSTANQQIEKIRARLNTDMDVMAIAHDISSVISYSGFIELDPITARNLHPQRQTEFNNLKESVYNKIIQLSRLPNITDTQRTTAIALQQAATTYFGSSASSAIYERSKAKQAMKQALNDLQHPPSPITSELWWDLASQRIASLHKLVISITNQITQESKKSHDNAGFTLLLYLITLMVAIILYIKVNHNLSSSLMDKIAAIAKQMKHMAENPKVELEVNAEGIDEVAQMANSLNAMLRERKKATAELSLAGAVFEHSSEAIIVTNAHNKIELINPAFTQVTGYHIDDIRGHDPSIMSSGRHQQDFYEKMWNSLLTNDRWDGEIWNRRKNGDTYPEYLAITVVRNDKNEIVQHIGLFIDISNRKQYERDIWYQRNFDTLTTLPNRTLCLERLTHEINQAKEQDAEFAVLMLDLDHFKYINDIQGHPTGDALLSLVSSRLLIEMPNQGFVARIGGDEFLIVLPQFINEFEVEQLCISILRGLEKPFNVNDQDDKDVEITGSIGVGFYPADGDDIDSLLKNTETAMYQAKQEGRNRFKCFTPAMDTVMRERIELEERLRKAVVRNEFFLHYQPIVDMSNSKVTGVEALIRWQDPTHGLMAPDRFIQVAEEIGLIIPIGNWVIEQALKDLAEWRNAGIDIKMSINMSGRQCQQKQGRKFVEHLSNQLGYYQIPAQSVNIEITESMLMQDTDECMNTLNCIRGMGCEVYIDDFGTGYSSLSYLKNFPISAIKIDRSFVDSALKSQSDANLIKAIVMMGQSLKMDLVAEGIETEAQWLLMKAMGCNYGQGYYMSKPISATELKAFIQSQTSQQPPSNKTVKYTHDI